MLKYIKDSYILKPRNPIYQATLTYVGPYMGRNESWKASWQLYIAKPWPCEDGIYEPPLMSMVSVHPIDLAFSLLEHVDYVCDERHRLIYEAVCCAKNPADLGVEPDAL